MKNQKRNRSAPGLGVDAAGGPVIDPTENVIALTEAANKRQDDLRALTVKLLKQQMRHVEHTAELRARHQRELDAAESTRLDSIRQIDREDVTKTAAQALSAIQTLAATTSTTAETLRSQVALTAQAAANQLAVITAEITKRVSALELALSEGKGKQTVADPMLEKLIVRVEALLEGRALITGRDRGFELSWGFVAAALSLVISLFAIGGIILKVGGADPPSPQYIYTPSPPGTLLPSAPPATLPPR